MHHLAQGYIWLISRNLCPCSLYWRWASRLCGRVDDYMIRHALL